MSDFLWGFILGLLVTNSGVPPPPFQSVPHGTEVF